MNYNPNLIYRVEHKPLEAVWRTLCYLPWAWLTLLAIFTLSVTIHYGHFPSYGNPEPFILTGIDAFLHTAVLFGIVALVYLNSIVEHHWDHSSNAQQPIVFPKRLIALYLLGISVYIWLSVSNFAGIIDWIWD